MEKFRVTIEGSLGSGKTTLLQTLGSMGYRVRLENVEDWTQLLQDYYAALGTRNAHLAGVRLQARIAVDSCLADSNVDFEERCGYTQPSTFMRHMLNTGGLLQEHVDMLETLIQQLGDTPRCIIYLRCDPQVALERIRRRNRGCEKDVSIRYMANMHQVYEQAVAEWREELAYRVEVHEVDVTEMSLEQVVHSVLQIRESLLAPTPSCPGSTAALGPSL